MIRRTLVTCVAAVLFSLNVIAQQDSTANVPRLLRFGGTLRSADGTVRTEVVGVTSRSTLYSRAGPRYGLSYKTCNWIPTGNIRYC